MSGKQRGVGSSGGGRSQPQLTFKERAERAPGVREDALAFQAVPDVREVEPFLALAVLAEEVFEPAGVGISTDRRMDD